MTKAECPGTTLTLACQYTAFRFDVAARLLYVPENRHVLGCESREVKLEKYEDYFCVT